MSHRYSTEREDANEGYSYTHRIIDMTGVKFRIEEIKILLRDEKAGSESNISDISLFKTHVLPCKIEYATSWIVRFECGVCHEIIDFDNSRQHSGTVLDCLFEPYYSKETLKSIASLFDNMKVFSNLEEPDKLYLTHKSYDYVSRAALFIPKVRLYHNICPNCKTQILYWLNEEHPRPPSKECHHGGPGFLRINEVIGIEVENNLNFTKLLNRQT